MPEHRSRRFGVSRRLLLASSVGLVLSAAAIWILVTRVDIGAVAPLVGRTNPLLIVAAVGTLGVSMLLRTQRWRSIFPESGVAGPPSVGSLLPIVLLGYALNQLLPMRLGDIARGGVAARRLRTGLPEALGSIGLERMLDAAALGAVAVVVSAGVLVPDWVTATSIGVLVAVAAAVGLVYALARTRVITRTKLASRVWAGLRASPRGIAASVAAGAAAWAVDGVTMWLVAASLGIDLSWQLAMLITVGAAIGAVLPSAPAAIGTFHLAGTAVGLAAGLAAESALAIVSMFHAMTVVAMVAAGGVSAVILGFGVRELRSATDTSMTRPRVAAAGEARP